MSMRISRLSGFYVHGLIFPLYLIILSSCAVAMIDVEDYPNRLNCLLTLLLTAGELGRQPLYVSTLSLHSDILTCCDGVQLHSSMLSPAMYPKPFI